MLHATHDCSYSIVKKELILITIYYIVSIYTHQNYETFTQQYIYISQKYVEESKANKYSGGDRCIR